MRVARISSPRGANLFDPEISTAVVAGRNGFLKVPTPSNDPRAWSGWPRPPHRGWPAPIRCARRPRDEHRVVGDVRHPPERRTSLRNRTMSCPARTRSRTPSTSRVRVRPVHDRHDGVRPVEALEVLAEDRPPGRLRAGWSAGRRPCPPARSRAASPEFHSCSGVVKTSPARDAHDELLLPRWSIGRTREQGDGATPD